MTRVAASIPVLEWAAERAQLTDAALTKRFPKWNDWVSGEAEPTLRQLEDFARMSRTAIGYFFLPEPPAIELPVPDFRTVGDNGPTDPSSNLLDTIYLCQQRQDWYRDYARIERFDPIEFVGSANIRQQANDVANRIRVAIGLSVQDRRQLRTWEEALRQLILRTEELGVLVMITSVVGSNTHRSLDVGEFRGFALADDLAPLIFVNGSDSKSAQMFTLMHELAHIWLGATGVSDPQPGRISDLATERWCNLVAAEVLMPIDAVRASATPGAPVFDEMR
ncbi:MAG: ImmA/IrrE family metallo-endopeptidase, partial [Planctomycetales bacterium]|nr:ImmA/IrrE family metallo-endopeptidase [Planctomycetales bacterium]